MVKLKKALFYSLFGALLTGGVLGSIAISNPQMAFAEAGFDLKRR